MSSTDRSGAEKWECVARSNPQAQILQAMKGMKTLRSGRNRRKLIYVLLLMGLLGLSGCGSPSSASMETSSEVTRTAETTQEEQTKLVKTGSMELQYAENFTVDYYEDGYKMLTTLPDSKRYLLVPEGQSVPGDLDEDICILQEPLQNIYLVASGVMDMFASVDAVDQIHFSGQKKENWYIQEAQDAMAAGTMVYAGKYNKPDYELLVSEGCDLAIENRMITHSPEVVEMLQSFEIPVMIEYSSYEQHPLGKVEWVKFFGALTGKESEAEDAFAEQTEILERVSSGEKTGKTIAFFYVTSNGLIQVRQSTDYIPKLIGLAGGRYIFDDLENSGSGRSTLNMQFEDFYAGAKDADILIYNSSIDGGVTTVDELIGKCNILKDFKAVQEGQVYCTTNDMYQQSMAIGYLLQDMHTVLTDDDTAKLRYLFPLQ